jgi:tetratricopeptide (TPR) repeat protein
VADERSWFVAPATATAVLLDQAQRQMLEGEYASAAALAEELLDIDPGNLDALLLVADAAPRYGHGEVGVLAARAVARRGAETGAVLAAALYAAGLADEALAEADACLHRNRDVPRAHAVRALALELLGRVAEADAAFARAHALRPEAYPLPFAVPDDDWDALLLRAVSALDRNDQAALRHWEIGFRGNLTPEDLARSAPPLPPSSTSFLLHDGEGHPRCVLYTRNLTRGCESEAEVVDRMVTALRNELEWLTADTP